MLVFFAAAAAKSLQSSLEDSNCLPRDDHHALRQVDWANPSTVKRQNKASSPGSLQSKYLPGQHINQYESLSPLRQSRTGFIFLPTEASLPSPSINHRHLTSLLSSLRNSAFCLHWCRLPPPIFACWLRLACG